MLANLLTIGGGSALEQLRRTDQHARSAKTALQRIVANKGLLQIGNRTLRMKALERDHLSAISLHGEHQTGTNDIAAHTHSAGAAHTVLTAHMRRGEVEFVPKKISEVLSR
jgi:hypothetical protein